MLAERGAKIVDADAIVHQLQVPGTEVFDDMVATFGEQILQPDGTLDRAKMGQIVFADNEKRDQLQKIVWPRVGQRVAELIAEAGEHQVVILDVPLMAEATATAQRSGA